MLAGNRPLAEYAEAQGVKERTQRVARMKRSVIREDVG
jgi:hypothetical protein